MEIPIKKTIPLEDNKKYIGVIINTRYRQKPYSYIDLEIEVKIGEKSTELKVGYPLVVSKASKLGQLLERFGAPLEGEKIDPDKILIGKPVSFQIKNETNDKGTFPRIVADSVESAEIKMSSFAHG